MTMDRQPFNAKLFTLGLVFLILVVSFLGLTIAVYRKDFTPIVSVTLRTDHVGDQLRLGSDVKLRGVNVGEVRSIDTDGSGASMQLAMDPALASWVPSNATAVLLPKTLFGERFVSLQIPAAPASPITNGAVLQQDRSASSVELNKVLDDLMPVLRTVQPQKVATTLSAVSEALDGQGKRLGTTLADLGDYLGQLKPSLGDLRTDLQRLSKVSDTYNQAAPQLIEAMSTLTTTSKTLVRRQKDLASLISSVTTVSTDLNSFLQVNSANLIDLAATTKPTLQLLQRYSPEYPCLLHQIADQVDTEDKVFGKGSSAPTIGRFTIEFTGSRDPYEPGKDTAKYADTRGPRCYERVAPPKNFPQYPPGGPIKDGSRHPAPPKGEATTSIVPGSTGPQSAAAPTIANSLAEQKVLQVMLSPTLKKPVREVPNWSGLLVGPLYRGSEVTLR
jgi:virulence factor Mce-like protein